MSSEQYPGQPPSSGRGSRRQVVKGVLFSALALAGVNSFLAACVQTRLGEDVQAGRGDRPAALPKPEKDPTMPSRRNQGRPPSGKGRVRIEGIGTLSFDASQVATLRPDIFQPGHFSMFDALVQLHKQGDIALDYHFDERMDTHLIDAINGQRDWWYEAYYSGGWAESNAFRMDMYPYKNGTLLHLHTENKRRLDRIHSECHEEVARLEANAGQVIIPEVTIRSPKGNWSFSDVSVIPHDTRSDLLQPDVVTALDALLSLQAQGQLSRVRLQWYESIGTATPVDSYWVEQIDDAVAAGGCGFVYETGSKAFPGFRGSHIHLPSDARVIVSPEYALWFWICL